MTCLLWRRCRSGGMARCHHRRLVLAASSLACYRCAALLRTTERQVYTQRVHWPSYGLRSDRYGTGAATYTDPAPFSPHTHKISGGYNTSERACVVQTCSTVRVSPDSGLKGKAFPPAVPKIEVSTHSCLWKILVGALRVPR